MTINQLPNVPSNFDLIEVPCAYNVTDYKLTFGYVQDSAARESITLTGGYARIDPPTIPGGGRIMFVTVLSWTSAGGAFNVVPYGPNQDYCYIIGESGITITGLRLRFWIAL